MRLLIKGLIILWTGSHSALGEDEFGSNYHTFNWQVEHGLPQNSIQLIGQTVDGYLWVITPNALARFDGRQFKTVNRSEIPGLGNQPVVALYGDRVGRLWIAARQRLISYLDGRFTEFALPSGLDNAQFAGLAEDHDGNCYALTSEGLCKIDVTNRRLVPVLNPLGKSGGAKVVADGRGRLWLANGNTLSRFSEGQWIIQSRLPFIIHSLMVDRTGQIWCGLNGGTIVQVSNDGSQHSSVVGTGTITSLAETERDGVFFRMEFNLYHFPTRQRLPLTLPNGSPVGHILALFRDYEGNLWVGTDGDGLLLLRRKPIKTYSIEHGIPDRHVATVAQDRAGRIWCGTLAGGLSILKNDRWESVAFPPSRWIGSLCQTTDGTIWIGTFGRHVWRLRETEIKLELKSRALACRALFEDRDRNLWIGGDGSDVEQFFPDGSVQRFDSDDGLQSDRVRCFAQDSSGAIWAGTENGLYRFEHGKVRSFFLRDGLGSDSIQALYVDQEGALWIGTDGGLTRYRNGQFVNLSTHHGLLHQLVVQILEDDRACLWLGTGGGLLQISRAELNRACDGLSPRVIGRAFGKAEGMRNLECTSAFFPNCLKGRDGRLWFCTADGLAVVDPSDLPISSVPPPVHIERFLADGTELTRNNSPFAILASGVSVLRPSDSPGGQPGPANASPLTVPRGARRLEIHFTGISFSNLERVRFKYKLEGYDQDWNESEMLNVASYTRVPPGKYSFRVQAGSSDGVWNPRLAELSFLVRPQFWQTWWFRAASTLTAGMIIFAFSYGPIHRRRQMERLRLRIARDLHDEVGSHLGTISLYNQLAQAKLAEQQPCNVEFQEIDRVIQRTAQSLRDVIWFINPEFDTLAGMLQHMEDAANRALAGKTVTFQVESQIPNRSLAVEFRRNMFLIFRELMHNILKHSQARHVQITVAIEKQNLILQIRDDGVGFDLNLSPQGHGLKNMKQRAAELGGVLAIDARTGKGATVLISVPL